MPGRRSGGPSFWTAYSVPNDRTRVARKKTRERRSISILQFCFGFISAGRHVYNLFRATLLRES